MRIGIGIDTGGTCTDAVAYDYESRTILAKGKALTTKYDLTVGINNALDKLPAQYVKDASVVALSTTLATNACVENKGCRAKLFIFGLGDEHLASFNAEQYGLKHEYLRGIDTHSSADGLKIDEPDWDLLFEKYGDWMADAEALTAAELYGTTSGAPCEKKLKALVEERLGIECVCANEVNDQVNVIARGATALLNSRLFPIIRAFIKAAETDFKERGCTAPISVVRSDGTLMSANLSRTRPVETILSGPSASISAGKLLANSLNYLIVDMGGTTTDVSIVQSGRPVKAGSGIRIGSWKTLVNGVFVDTFALGGDTTIRIEKKEIKILTRKAIPFCTAAIRWPGVKESLQREFEKNFCSKDINYEFIYLLNEPADRDRFNEQELTLIDSLRSQGAVMLHDIPAKTGIRLYNLDTSRLESEAIIMRCAMTPTDLMHVRGDYTEYDREASLLAVKCVLNAWGLPCTESDIQQFIEDAYERIELKLYRNLMRILLSQLYPKEFTEDFDGQLSFIIDETWKKRNEKGFRTAAFNFATDLDLVGVGAPTHVFLPEVAKALGANCIIPEHAEVANAIGALMANIDVYVEIDVSYRIAGGKDLFIVHTKDGSVPVNDYEIAYHIAEKAAHDQARVEALMRGAPGEPEVKTYIKGHPDSDIDAIRYGGTIVGEATFHSGK